MAEYIEREAVMQAFTDYVWNSNHSDFVPAPQWNHAVEIVRDIPAADVAEVRHGRWILFSKKFGTVVCDKCHRQDHFDLLAKYCRYCGTRMDGGEA